MNRSKTTTDHDEIRQWAEARGGIPSAVKGAKGLGTLRIDFPDERGEGTLAPIGWDEWFATFDAANLAMVLEETADGERHRLVARDTTRKRGARTSRRPPARAAARKQAKPAKKATGRKGAKKAGARATKRRSASR